MKLLVPILNDRHLPTTRGLVELFTHGLFIDNVEEVDHTGCVGHDGLRIGIPAEELVTGLDDLSLFSGQCCTVRYA